MNNLVEVRNLTKNYGKKQALDSVDITIKKGKVVGILGPNGSGKTTLIKILAGMLRPSTGEVIVDGKQVGVATKSIVSYLPDRNFLYKWMKVKDAYQFYVDFFPDFNKEKFHQLLTYMKLSMDMKVESLSKGMHEKLNLALILSRNAKLYILDEPIAGVDPVARDQILDAIINNIIDESSLIITTHLVRDMENILEEVVLIKDGKIALTGETEKLREERGKQIEEIYKEVFGEVHA
ncbi:ABC transporter ATP-binding protein [Bacillus kwashiorkori]|uniref:ABC transporter ATP-binding protein n=1 Tax=Bacillus kwashiorkori TaxID=1522318 RepID=UPI000785E1FA|nr:ABC transporter ATP-binding protein [Bacillus kwashiorkori]